MLQWSRPETACKTRISDACLEYCCPSFVRGGLEEISWKGPFVRVSRRVVKNGSVGVGDHPLFVVPRVVVSTPHHGLSSRAPSF
jgi:hypothetical protein